MSARRHFSFVFEYFHYIFIQNIIKWLVLLVIGEAIQIVFESRWECGRHSGELSANVWLATAVTVPSATLRASRGDCATESEN